MEAVATEKPDLQFGCQTLSTRGTETVIAKNSGSTLLAVLGAVLIGVHLAAFGLLVWDLRHLFLTGRVVHLNLIIGLNIVSSLIWIRLALKSGLRWKVRIFPDGDKLAVHYSVGRWVLLRRRCGLPATVVIEPFRKRGRWSCRMRLKDFESNQYPLVVRTEPSYSEVEVRKAGQELADDIAERIGATARFAREGWD